MKTNNYLKPVIVIGLLFIAAIALKGQGTQIFEKEMEVSSNTTLTIDNKFGDIETSTWNKNRILVTVNVSGDFKNESEINKKVEIEFASSTGEISLETIIDGNLGSKSTQINYTVKMPAAMNINFENEFGNLYLETLTGEAEIENKFGNVKLGTLKGNNNQIDIKFGNLKITDFNSGVIDINNGNTEITKARKLRLDAKFGNVELGKVKEATVELKNGSFSIEEVDKLNIDGAFGGLKIQEVTGELILDNSHGNTEINRIVETASKIKIDNKFGKVKLGISDEAAYNISCEVKMGSFYYPEELANFDKMESSMMSKEYSGKLGKNPGNNHMEIESKNGDVVIFVY